MIDPPVEFNDPNEYEKWKTSPTSKTLFDFSKGEYLQFCLLSQFGFFGAVSFGISKQLEHPSAVGAKKFLLPWILIILILIG